MWQIIKLVSATLIYVCMCALMVILGIATFAISYETADKTLAFGAQLCSSYVVVTNFIDGIKAFFELLLDIQSAKITILENSEKEKENGIKRKG